MDPKVPAAARPRAARPARGQRDWIPPRRGAWPAKKHGGGGDPAGRSSIPYARAAARIPRARAGSDKNIGKTNRIACRVRPKSSTGGQKIHGGGGPPSLEESNPVAPGTRRQRAQSRQGTAHAGSMRSCLKTQRRWFTRGFHSQFFDDYLTTSTSNMSSSPADAEGSLGREARQGPGGAGRRRGYDGGAWRRWRRSTQLVSLAMPFPP